MDNLNFKHLKYFWTVAKTGSIARASEQLHLTPQSISGQLTEFEERLGVELFRRTGRNRELTDAGRRILTYAEEIFARQNAHLPPFSRLAAIVVSGADRAAAEAHARALVRAAWDLPADDRFRVAPAGGLPEADEIVVLGPAEAPIAMVRGRHRFRLLVRAPRTADLQAFLRAVLAAGPAARGNVRAQVDVDPMSFL